MHQYYLGIDVSKACSDFIILNDKKEPIEKNFQLGDSFQAENHFMSIAKKWIFTQMLINRKSQLLKWLESSLYTDNPELLTYYNDGVPEWILKLLIGNTITGKFYLWNRSSPHGYRNTKSGIITSVPKT